MTNPTPTFVPVNDFERVLLEVQQGQLPVASLIEALLASKVLVLIDKEIGPSGVWDNSVSPMVITGLNGDALLAVFSSPDRSKDWPARFPEYCYGFWTDFRWILQGMTSAVGLVINPGSTVGCELPPTGIEQLKSEIALGKFNTSN